MTKKPTDLVSRDDLATLIADSLNTSNKDHKVAFFLDGQESTPTDLETFVSTGAVTLDVSIANRKHGGLPFGRIAEFTGMEGSGKSLLAATVIKNVQDMGGIGVLIDTESAVNRDFFRAIGLDMSKFLYINLDAVEEIFDTVTKIIEKIRKSDKDKPVVIVVDSLSGASTLREIEADFTKDGYNTDKAQILGKAMRKLTNLIARQKILLIFTNQLRMKMNAMPFADPYTTSGGKAVQFHSSVRLRLALKGKIKNSSGDVIGTSVKVEVKKNRIGPPHRVAEFDIYYDRGIDDYSSWLSVLTDAKVIKKSGGWYSYKDESGEETKFQSKKFPDFLNENLERKEQFYDLICDHLIMRYREYDAGLLDFENVSEE